MEEGEKLRLVARKA